MDPETELGKWVYGCWLVISGMAILIFGLVAVFWGPGWG